MQIVTKFSSISFEVKHVNCYLLNIGALLKDPLISALIVGTSMHCSIPLDGNKPIIIIIIIIIFQDVLQWNLWLRQVLDSRKCRT